jgi:hypothetical protein
MADNSLVTATSALTAFQQNVAFINQQVLHPVSKPMDGGSKMIADQAAALMVEDMRSFLQGCEQILTVAMAKAAALATNPATVSEGTVAIQSVTTAMAALPTYATNIAGSAGSIIGAFSTVAATAKAPTLSAATPFSATASATAASPSGPTGTEHYRYESSAKPQTTPTTDEQKRKFNFFKN